MRTKIQVMKESVFLVAYVDKGRVKPGHELLDLGDVYIAHGVGNVAALFLERHQTTILKQGYGDLLGLHIDDQFAFH